MKKNWFTTAPLTGLLLSGLLLLGSAPAQNISIYGGRADAGGPLKVEVYAPAGTVFTLERVVDPLAMFAASPDPHSPVLPAGAKTLRVRSVKLGRGGELNFGRVPDGVYLVRAGAMRRVVIVSRLGLVVKRDAAQTLLYAADQQTGQTRPARVWALGTALSAVADAQGLLRWKGGLGKEQVFLAKYGDAWAISDSGWNSYAAPKVRGHVYTDRPVYRPGHHVEFKAVLRQATSLQPLAGAEVRARVLSPDDEEVYRGTLTADAYGSVHAGFDLSAGAKVGEYRVEIVRAGPAEGDELEIGGAFAVEAYQKPEYEVTVTPSRTAAVQGEKLSVRVSAKYLFGGSVSGARVNYSVTRAPYYPPGFDTEALPPEQEGSDYGSDLVIQEETRLNARGELDLTLPLERDEDGRPVSYRIQAEVEDESRRTVAGSARVIAYPAALNVEARTNGYVYDAGTPIRVDLDTRDLGGVGRAAPVTVDLIRQDWREVRGKWVLSEQRLARQTARTDARGRGAATLRAPRGGGYVLRTTVQDAQGRRSVFENWLWVLQAGESWGWNFRELSLTLDRRTYRAGDTATVLIGNPTPGAPVLLTLEGQTLRSWVVLRGAGATLTHRFRVSADMTPNIHVAAVSLGGGNLHSGEKALKVPRVGAELSVKVTPDKARYAPGETGNLSVQVQNAAGQGVPADLALSVVDQAIYLIRRDDSPALAQVFDAPRLNAVGTRSSLDFYFEQTGPVASAPRAPMTEAAFAQSKEGREADASAGEEVTPRQDFKDTLLWVPNLVTDAQGRASVEVKFPDNLTTWVATARAQTTAPRFGQTTARTLVTKDVIARLSLPTFLVRGDTATLGATVNNTLGQALGGQASLVLSGLGPVAGAAMKPGGAPFQVAANGRTRLDNVVRATGIGTASTTFTARTPQGSDALKLSFPVRPRGYEERRTLVGSAARPTTFTVPQGATPQTVRLDLSLTPSLLSAVAPALEFLAGYPYGCTEQTMSRFLPALLARQALGSGALPDTLKTRLDEYVDLGLARLEQFQHGDGGWNFWENDRSTLEMSAYVTGGLLRAKGAGAKVNNTMLDNGLKYLARRVQDPQERQAERATAFRVLADAGRVNVAALNAFARRAELTPYSLAQVSLALSRAGQKQAALDTLSRLKARRLSANSGQAVYWENPRQREGWYWYWDDNRVQVTAVALEALARLEPQSPLIPGASQWLLGQRRGPQWLSTQDTAQVVMAALALPRAKPGAAAQVTVELDGQPVQTVSVGATGAATLSVPRERLGDGQHQLTLSGAPAGLTYAAELTYAREPATLSAVADRGLVLNRKYERLTPVWDDKNKRYRYSRSPLLRGGSLQPVTVGDLILVTLSVKPGRDARYLLISDPIPAGMKALDERSLSIAGLRSGDEYGWDEWSYWYSGRDLLDDRVNLYAYYVSGAQTMTYVLRAQTPGTYTALPTHAFLMYDPDVEGYGPAATFTVRDR